MKQYLGQKNYTVAFVGNMDETPVYFDLVPSKFVDRIGVKLCIVKTTGAENRYITVTLTVTANGEMLPPFIISKVSGNLKWRYVHVHAQTCMHACN